MQGVLHVMMLTMLSRMQGSYMQWLKGAMNARMQMQGPMCNLKKLQGPTCNVVAKVCNAAIKVQM